MIDGDKQQCAALSTLSAWSNGPSLLEHDLAGPLTRLLQRTRKLRFPAAEQRIRYA